ncbi:MAG TPA: histidine kinase [Pyrinomonadaceae bacterium]|nr:histidine kinase [Pyrinomonadaceae bacterium]
MSSTNGKAKPAAPARVNAARRSGASYVPTAFQSADDRIIGLVRLALALAALAIIYIDPSEPDKNVALTYVALVLYALYSATVYALSLRRGAWRPGRVTHWIDVACYLVLVSLSSGTSSIYFFFFFFAIIIASFRFGFVEGLKVTVASAVLFTLIGFATSPGGEKFEMDRFLMRPVYLLTLGYMMAYWGGWEIKLRQQSELMRGVTRLSNPRFDVGYTIGSMLEKLRAFYDADECLMVLTDPRDNEYRLFRLRRGESAESVQAELIPPGLARQLLSLPENCSAVHRGKSRLRSLLDSGYYSSDAEGSEARAAGRDGESLAAKLGAESFICVPLHYREKSIGRLYMTAPRGVFEGADVAYLTQVGEQIMPVIHNIRLLERLASNSAEQERQRLARDIHDSVIQPYIGLQYKLAAIRNKVAEGKDVGDDIERAFRMTVEEIAGLRGFVRGLRKGEGREGDFVSAVERFAAQFAQNYDLDVKVECKGDFRVNDRLASDLIQIVHEGLSNVRKHTAANASKVTLERADGLLRVSVENDDPRGEESAGAAFTPRSIAERAEVLGGHVAVERTREGHTLVRVEIPL